MFQDETTGTAVYAAQPALFPEQQFATVHHILFDTLTTVRNTMKLLHKINYTSPIIELVLIY